MKAKLLAECLLQHPDFEVLSTPFFSNLKPEVIIANADITNPKDEIIVKKGQELIIIVDSD